MYQKSAQKLSTDEWYSKSTNFTVKQKIMKISSHNCTLILSFDVVNQILAQFTGAKIHSDILVYENSDISDFTEKDISIISYLSMYLGHFTDGCVLQNPIAAVIIKNSAYHFQ